MLQQILKHVEEWMNYIAPVLQEDIQTKEDVITYIKRSSWSGTFISKVNMYLLN